MPLVSLPRQGYAPYNPRKRNQDAIIMHEHAATGTVLLGVLDGHGEAGDLVSHFVSERIAPRVFRHPDFTTDPGRSIAEELDRLERTMLADSAIDTEFSGSTAVIAAVRDRQIHVCNVGDSRVIVARDVGGKLTAVDVSNDHKPDLPEEKRRIEAAGGRVFAVEYEDGVSGPPRVWLGHMDIPGLAMSRSIGDSVAHSAGVISVPERFSFDIQDNDKMIIIASDGLWEFMTSQQVLFTV